MSSLPESPRRFRPLSFISHLAVFILGLVLGAGYFLLPHHAPTGPGSAGGLAGLWEGTASLDDHEVSLAVTLRHENGELVGELDATPGGSATFHTPDSTPEGAISFSMTVAGEPVTFTGTVMPDQKSMGGQFTTPRYGSGNWSLEKKS
jgi:hypothetical protein